MKDILDRYWAMCRDAGIYESAEVVATLIAADELHSLHCSIEYRGV